MTERLRSCPHSAFDNSTFLLTNGRWAVVKDPRFGACHPCGRTTVADIWIVPRSLGPTPICVSHIKKLFCCCFVLFFKKRYSCPGVQKWTCEARSWLCYTLSSRAGPAYDQATKMHGDYRSGERRKRQQEIVRTKVAGIFFFPFLMSGMLIIESVSGVITNAVLSGNIKIYKIDITVLQGIPPRCQPSRCMIILKCFSVFLDKC